MPERENLPRRVRPRDNAAAAVPALPEQLEVEVQHIGAGRERTQITTLHGESEREWISAEATLNIGDWQ